MINGKLSKQRTELTQLEDVIERGMKTFFEVGAALKEIRDSRLYNVQGFETFEDYCSSRWGFARSTAYQYIDAHEVVDNVRNCGQIVPANEAQARPLAKLPPGDQQDVWQTVVERAPEEDGVKLITSKLVQEVVKEHTTADQNPPPPKYPLSDSFCEWLEKIRLMTNGIVLGERKTFTSFLKSKNWDPGQTDFVHGTMWELHKTIGTFLEEIETWQKNNGSVCTFNIFEAEDGALDRVRSVFSCWPTEHRNKVAFLLESLINEDQAKW